MDARGLPLKGRVTAPKGTFQPLYREPPYTFPADANPQYSKGIVLTTSYCVLYRQYYLPISHNLDLPLRIQTQKKEQERSALLGLETPLYRRGVG
jgi:hypothetical protein